MNIEDKSCKNCYKPVWKHTSRQVESCSRALGGKPIADKDCVRVEEGSNC